MAPSDVYHQLLQSRVRQAEEAAGGTAALARGLGISSQAVSQWRKIPAERVPQVVVVSGLPHHVLRPDLYPLPIGAPILGREESRNNGR